MFLGFPVGACLIAILSVSSGSWDNVYIFGGQALVLTIAKA